ncbi:hypothetical protein KCP78_25005 [Salmonella enterica subsp. enterica]|nr:hypothetical protein KCP78_25005 [Salmonella enterica subsp. enterica]
MRRERYDRSHFCGPDSPLAALTALSPAAHQRWRKSARPFSSALRPRRRWVRRR